MKGVLLCGGKGTRLQPATRVMNKHMIPIVATPMVLYPLSTLRDVFGITDILVVSGGNHIGAFADFLGDGGEWGVRLTYKVQQQAGGIAQALDLAKDFIGGERSVVVLGDNIFDNAALKKSVRLSALDNDHAHVFLKKVAAPERFGVAKFGMRGKMTAIIEKPKKAPSTFAVTGIYSYPPDVFEKIATLTPSGRGELEVTDIHNLYIREGRLSHSFLKGFWSDAGTPESLALSVAWASGRGGDR